MKIEQLLTPVSIEDPCGENLEYDAGFMAMEQAAAGKQEQQFGDTIIPAEAPDWSQVERLAASLLERTKDLRVMLTLTRAWTQLQGLSGYASGISLIHQALERYWDSIFPLLEFDGELDPLFRINVLADLGDKSPLTLALRQATLLKNAGGEISVRDACALLDGSKQENSGYPGGKTRLLDELAQGGQPGIDAILNIAQTLNALRETITRHLGESALPEMSLLQKTIGALAQACQSQTPLAVTQPPEGQPDESEQVIKQAASAPAVMNWQSMQITSRDDVQLVLEKTKQYFQQYEPSHPAPLLIDRVQRLIKLNFMDIVRDLAPDGVNQLETIFGRPDSQGE
ncbi:type VI secretion system protein TssA [Affinibrenneria salicis]|uniref:Type VI secretion system protein TssA n=1 Tax=Affinibrenneria salicis TaxID=2590031 RepID=A0A5J5FWG7_9GAMM|nr:type VI secretion system protein TssA [Affinibrenneria salicis]KAA8998158.1 type VI secretion system protein TssA [Affinibrenneria salicis]